jgi:hypothetical protein
MALWSNRPGNTFVDIRKGGAGNTWQPLERDGQVNAPSGGGQPVESRFGRGENGELTPVGSIVTGNPERWTGQMMTRLKTEVFLSELTKIRCFFDIRVRQICDDPYTLTNYTAAIAYDEAWVTSRTYSDNLANATEDTEADLMNQYDFSAIYEYRYKKLRHDNVQKTVSDFAFNKVRNVSPVRCSSDCGVQTDGNEEWIAVTDTDNTPGYASNPAPLFYYTTDKLENWSSIYINVFPNGNATDVVKAGEYVLAASPTFGVAYARYQDIKDGAVNPNVWTLATGFTAPNGANKLAVVNGSTVLAVGNGGRIWRSTDGGLSFTLIDNGVTTSQNLNAVVFANEVLGWIGGNAGVLLRYSNGVISQVIVQTSAALTLSSNINVVATPPGRDNEVYVGTAGGQIWRTRQSTANRPLFEVLVFDQTGNGQINDLQFAGYKGDVMFIVQTNAASNSRVLRDNSGGAGGSPNIEVVGGYTSPANNGINSLAVADQNEAVTVGEVVNSYAWIGHVVGE